MDLKTCPECGAPLHGVADCREYLNEMIRWDFEDFEGVGQIHHLTVLSYNLQHPSAYSSKGLENAKRSLAEFLKYPLSYKKHGMLDRENLGSDVRDWKIAGTADDHGVYPQRPAWKIHASDVVQEGKEKYVENVKNWSQSVLEAIADTIPSE